MAWPNGTFPGTSVLEFYGVPETLSIGACVGVLIGMTVAFRIAAYVVTSSLAGCSVYSVL